MSRSFCANRTVQGRERGRILAEAVEPPRSAWPQWGMVSSYFCVNISVYTDRHVDKQQSLAVVFGHEMPDMQPQMSEVRKAPERSVSVQVRSVWKDVHGGTRQTFWAHDCP